MPSSKAKRKRRILITGPYLTSVEAELRGVRTMRADKLWGLKSGQSSPGQKGKKVGLARARQHPGGLTSPVLSRGP